MNKISIAVFLTATFILGLASAGAVDDQPMKFRDAHSGGNCNACAWLAAEGLITETTADEFRRAARGKRNVLVRLNSSGGSALGGIALGYAFRELGATVIVGRTEDYDGMPGYDLQSEKSGVCLSACGFAFMGGLFRYADDGELGVHRVFINDPEAILPMDNDGMFQSGQLMSALIVGYLIEMGIDPDVFSTIVQTGRDDIRFLTTYEMDKWGILNTSWRSVPWAIDLSSNNPVAFTISSLGPHHFARLEYFCKSRRPTLRISLRLPQSYLTGGWSGIGDMASLLPDDIELFFSRAGSPQWEFVASLSERQVNDEYVYGFIHDSSALEAAMRADQVEMRLHASMVAMRQYEHSAMMSPTFSLRQSARAINLIASNC